MNTYIYRNAPVDKARVMTPTPEDAKAMSEHFQYLKDKLAAGELVIAGPCTDAAFGIVVFHAESDEAAKQFMANDPAIREGLMTAELHPFRVSLLAQEPPARG